MDDNEVISRLPSLVFSGPPFKRRPQDADNPEAEDVERTVLEVVRHHYNVNVSSADIARAHRLPGEQKVIVRFIQSGRGSLRDQIYYRRLELRGTGIFVNECLSRSRQDILNRLLTLKRARKLFSVFSRNGQVYFTKRKNERPVRVNSVTEIEELTGE